MSKIIFSRDKVSILDHNPYNNLYVDKIIEQNFYNNYGARIGIVKKEISKEEKIRKIESIKCLVEQYINKNCKTDYCVEVLLKNSQNIKK